MEKVKINNIKFEFRCNSCYEEKAKNQDCPALKIELMILKNGKQLTWEEFKGSYSAEKISNFIKNTINGQRTFYWKYKGN